MNAWIVLRILIVAAFGWSGLWWAKQPETFPWWSLAFYFFFPVSALPVIIGIALASDYWHWRRPSWHRNPFAKTDPLDNAHFAAFCCMACGIVGLLYLFSSTSHPPLTRAPLPALLLVAGISFWLGVRLCIFLFRDKLEV